MCKGSMTGVLTVDASLWLMQFDNVVGVLPRMYSVG